MRRNWEALWCSRCRDGFITVGHHGLLPARHRRQPTSPPFGLVCSFVAASVGLAAADGAGCPVVAAACVVLVLLGVVVGVARQRRFAPASGSDPAAEPEPTAELRRAEPVRR
ncbi:hypothetical protein [Micromonospora sp. L31]|uniref:hypothetical protein n=1 Tax=Micromonospora sp. L31 TaxID=3452213 RepID=UPI003F8B2ED5